MTNRWVLGVAFFLVTTAAFAQQTELTATVREPVAMADVVLPDSPGALRSGELTEQAGSTSASTQQAAAASVPVAPEHAKLRARTIAAGQIAEPWVAKDKFIAAFQKQVSPGGLASPVFVAGIQQIRDSRPHYGTDSGAYGARIGAAYARQSTQSFLNLGVMSSLLHDDPRYYVLGPTHTFKSRVIYAASRVWVTRKDDGNNTANIPLVVGVVASQAMAEGFYPDQDRKWSRTFTGSLGSLASKMATLQFKEFGGEIRRHIPFRKQK